MRKLTNLLFIAVCLALFCSVIGYKVAETAGVLPEALSNGTQSNMEGRALQAPPAASLTSLNEGTFQTQAETYLSDRFPAKESVLLANAAGQRMIIQTANLPFGFDVYPTYFGSERVYSPEYDALFIVPEKLEDDRGFALSQMVDAITQCSENEAYRVIVSVPDSSRYSASNPLAPYVTDSESMGYFEEYLLTPLQENGVTVLMHEHGSTGDWLQYYYANDHHWNIQGAYQAYERIVQELGFEPLEVQSVFTVEGYEFLGSNARIALCTPRTEKPFEDYVLPYPEYRITYNGEPFERNQKESYIDGSSEERFIGYGTYFGNNLAYPIVYQQNALTNGKKLLLVTDSFGTALEPMLAAHYQETHVIHPINLLDEDTLEHYANEQGIDDIVILSALYDYSGDEYQRFFGCS